MGGRSGSGAPIEIIAHRGFSAAAPENTVAALTAAIEAGAHALEFDLQVTADGVPVLLHDDTLDRTTDATGSIDGRSAADLHGIDAGGWFGDAFVGEPLPTLAAALAEIADFEGALYPEIKPSGTAAEAVTIADCISAAGALARTTFISMNWDALRAVRDAYPAGRLGYIVERVERTDAAFDLVRGDPLALVDFDARILMARPALAERAADLGIELAVWTVNEEADAARLLEMGVRRFTTNEVIHLLQWVETT